MRHKRNHFLSDPSDLADVDLTPLIDVVFVVLIMFIIVAPMLEIDKIQLAQGAAREQVETTQMGAVAIQVREDNTIWINKHEVSQESLLPLLKALYQKNPKLNPQLFQDKKAQFGVYQKVKNAVEEAGFEELEVVLEPSS